MITPLGGHTHPPFWALCEHPERPTDEYACAHLVACKACRVGVQAAIARGDKGRWPDLLLWLVQPPDERDA